MHLCAVLLSFQIFTLAYAVTPLSVVQSLTSQELIKQGRESYLNRCSGCHGTEADGKGPAALMLNPKPRNLAAGEFKFRSTPSGSLPTTDDLLRVIDQGVPGASMPTFRDVSQQEKLALVAYIRSLRPEFQSTKPELLRVNIPVPPRDIFETKQGILKTAKAGAALYRQACLSCHGETGRGDGPAASELTDSDNNPIRPANLRLQLLKSGSTAQDAFKAITTGLDGSPMPGFADVFDERKRWEIVSYIWYLRGLEAHIYDEQKDKIQ